MDQSRDIGGRQLYRIIKLYEPPEFVKTASNEALIGSDDLPQHVYGDPRSRLYPCDTAAATWLSMAYFTEKRAEFRRDDARIIEDRIMHCARVHGIEKELKALQVKIANTKITPEDILADDDYAIVHGAERHYPLRNSLEVVKAAEYLDKWRDKMPYELRQQMADKILNKSAVIGVTLGALQEMVEKQAGHGTCTAADAVYLIEGRVFAGVKGPGAFSEIQQGLQKIAGLIKNSPSKIREPGMLCKIAGALDTFDRTHGLVGQYGPDFPRIEDVLFGITGEKMASVVNDHCVTVTGHIYKLADLERVRIRDVQEIMGDKIAAAMTTNGVHVDSEKAASVIPTMDRGYANLFEQLLSEKGVMPVAQEASPETIKISNEYLNEMRKAHAAMSAGR